jgi:hypothetical protein
VDVRPASEPLEPIPPTAIKVSIDATGLPAPHSPPPPRTAEPLPDPGLSTTSPDRVAIRLRSVIADCWREAPKPLVGEAKISMAIAPAGSVSDVSVLGSAPETLRACIAERLRPMTLGAALDGLRVRATVTLAAP